MSTKQRHFLVLVFYLTVAWGSNAATQDGFLAHADRDYATALKEFLPAAEEGDPEAQVALGGMYDRGEGVPQDFQSAVRWYRLAALQGNGSAQYNLALKYVLGQGVEKDAIQAFFWAVVSAENGIEEGAELRDFLASEMSASELSLAEDTYREWRKESVNKNLAKNS